VQYDPVRTSRRRRCQGSLVCSRLRLRDFFRTRQLRDGSLPGRAWLLSLRGLHARIFLRRQRCLGAVGRLAELAASPNFAGDSGRPAGDLAGNASTVSSQAGIGQVSWSGAVKLEATLPEPALCGAGTHLLRFVAHLYEPDLPFFAG